MIARRAWRAVRPLAPGRPGRGRFGVLLLALGGLATIRLGLTLAAVLQPAPPVEPGAVSDPAPRVAAPAAEALPEPAAGPETESAEPAGAAPEADEPSSPPRQLDPARLTPSEIELLQQLAARAAVSTAASG